MIDRIGGNIAIPRVRDTGSVNWGSHSSSSDLVLRWRAHQTCALVVEAWIEGECLHLDPILVT
eukprot:2784431-Amphidinium_carterae.1